MLPVVGGTRLVLLRMFCFCTVVVVIAMLQRGGVTKHRFSDVRLHSAPWAVKLNFFISLGSVLVVFKCPLYVPVVGEVGTLGLCSL